MQQTPDRLTVDDLKLSFVIDGMQVRGIEDSSRFLPAMYLLRLPLRRSRPHLHLHNHIHSDLGMHFPMSGTIGLTTILV